MWTRTGRVLSVSSRALTRACERLGLDTEALLQAAGITRDALEDPDRRFESRQVSALWAKAYELSRDPVLSLHAAEACPFGAYKVIDFMASNASTVGEAFRYASRYFKLINTAVRLPIDESTDPVTMDVLEDSGPSGVTRPYAEYCFAAFVLHIREATGVDFPVERLTFVHPAPPDVREHERIFRCPPEFGAAHNRLHVRRAHWERASARPHPGVLEVLSQHADQLMEKLPRGPDLVQRTRRVLGERLRGGDSSLEAVARDLSLSARSLQRHLRELGYSYQSLADEVRAATARFYLEQPDIALAEIAYLLGFAEPSAFHRAFRRWTGETPSRYRARGAPGPRTPLADGADDPHSGSEA